MFHRERKNFAEIMRPELEKVLNDYTVIDGHKGEVIKPETLAKLLTFHVDKVLKNYERQE